MDTARKLDILTSAAKYDAACTSSGVDRDAKLGHLGSTACAGICHSFSADGRCITLLKVLMTNACLHDCAYCANRRSNDIPRAAFDPAELANLTIEFYKRNYIEGLFLSSGVLKSPDFTMELMYRTVDILRNEHGFLGYIHVKAIPGASPEIVQAMGYLADRMSTNIEMPSMQSLRIMAPGKSKESILSPMDQLARGIRALPKGKPRRRARAGRKGGPDPQERGGGSIAARGGVPLGKEIEMSRYESYGRFVPAGQSTQLIVGATPESDFQILKLSSALYRSYSLKRVFYSAYLPINDLDILPDKSAPVPLGREHRLYQADWLMRFYGFSVDEIIDESDPFLDTQIDPKAGWAIRNLELFPVEINKAPYDMLLRVPGLGVTGAKKIVRARMHSTLTHDSLKTMGLSLKRMRMFITCAGKYEPGVAFEADAIRAELIRQHSAATHAKGRKALDNQLSLFDLSADGFREPAALPAGCDGSPFSAGQLEAFANQRLLLERTRLAQEKAVCGRGAGRP